ncbi:hypothetical protein MBLNU457_g0694t1 [Dothideomycetes sp. NU457]
MADDSRISPYNLSDCKNTTDDALQNYLNSLKIQQSNFYTDTKLILGYTAVLLSAACFYWDYTLGFEATKHYTLAAVLLYFALNGAFTYWTWYVEADTVYVGSRDGRQLMISTKTKKFDPVYRLTARYTTSSSDSSSAMKEISIDAPVMRWFTADGFFVPKPFQTWLASGIPMVGELDPKNAMADGKGGAQEQTIDPGLLQAAMDGFATGTKGVQGGKKRKG